MVIFQAYSQSSLASHRIVSWAHYSLFYTLMISPTFCLQLNLIYLLMTPNVYILALLNLITHYCRMTLMLWPPTATHGICYLMKQSVFIFTSSLNLHLIFRITTSTTSWSAEKTEETKDLGIIFNTDLCWDEHHRTITSRAYRCLYLLKRTFTTHAVTSKKLLYISLVRAQLTYCSQLWRLYLIKDIIVLEFLKGSTSCHKIHFEWLSIKLQISSLDLKSTPTNVLIWNIWHYLFY